jgi:hypothetical protein
MLLKAPGFLDRGATSTLTLHSNPSRVFALFLSNGFEGAAIPGIPEPVPITSGSLLAFLGALTIDGSGIGRQQVQVPNDPALTGVAVFVQAFGVKPQHVLVSNPIGDTIR